MTRTRRLIIAALALADVIIIGIMMAVVIRSMSPPPLPTLIPTPAAQIPPTSLPTWTPSPTPTPQPTETPWATHTLVPTVTPWSTWTPTDTPTPSPTLSPTPLPGLANPTFDGILENEIPGWQMGSFVNWAPGDPFDQVTSFAAPRFHAADDPRQRIHGSTLQIDTEPWVKLRAWVYQTMTLPVGSVVQFRIQAMGFVKHLEGGYILKVGIDAQGHAGCEKAQWGPEQIVNQEDGVITLASPEVIVGEAGQVTVCAFAETQFAQVYHAAFFDDAELIVRAAPTR